jgi:hypothetical protein
VKELSSDITSFRQHGPQVDLKVVAPRTSRRRGDAESGIEVREEELVSVSSQRMYKMRCECGRSWFELECRQFVHCPACHKLGLVAT